MLQAIGVETYSSPIAYQPPFVLSAPNYVHDPLWRLASSGCDILDDEMRQDCLHIVRNGSAAPFYNYT